jgi:hypothetical protein
MARCSLSRIGRTWWLATSQSCSRQARGFSQTWPSYQPDSSYSTRSARSRCNTVVQPSHWRTRSRRGTTREATAAAAASRGRSWRRGTLPLATSRLIGSTTNQLTSSERPRDPAPRAGQAKNHDWASSL